MKLLLAGSCAFALAALAPAAVVSPQTVRGAIDTPATDVAPFVTWAELQERPARYVGRPVRVELQFHSRIAKWNPFLTRFGASTYTAFRLWSDEQFLWDAEVHAAPAARVFVRRGNDAELPLDLAETFQRFELRCVVREVFLGEPWVEVVGATALRERVTEAGLIHARRFVELCANGATKLAEAECERALAGAWPAKARAELLRLRSELAAGAARLDGDRMRILRVR